MMYPYYMSLWGGWNDLLSLLLWLIVIAFIIRLIVRVSLGRGWHRCRKCENCASSPIGPEKAPLDIVKERYAKGEITKKEYEEKKKEFAD